MLARECAAILIFPEAEFQLTYSVFMVKQKDAHDFFIGLPTSAASASVL